MNEELDKTKIEDENNAPAASVSEEAKESPSNDELNESLQNEILEEGQLPHPTMGFQRVIQRAVQQVHAAG